MNSKTTTYIFLAFIAILGWNAFLIKRDDALYKAYYRQQAIENLKHPPSSEIGYNPKEKFCRQQAGWHPDCNVE
jgi:hypothetical protein